MSLPASSTGNSRLRIASVAADKVAGVLAVRIVVAAVFAVAAAGGALLLFRHSIRESLWGPFLADASTVTIERYSTPWLLASAGLLLIAGLLVVSAITDLVRRRRLGRGSGSQNVLGHWSGA